MRYQAVISGLGEHIHIPVDAQDDKQAYALASTYAEQHLPSPLRQHVQVSRLAEGEEAKDDRAELTFSVQGRPVTREGRYRRITLEVREDLLAKIDASGKSRREYIEVLLQREFDSPIFA